MALLVCRGLARSHWHRYNRAICLPKYYSANPNANRKPIDEPAKPVVDESSKKAMQKMSDLQTKLGPSNNKSEEMKKDIKSYFLTRFTSIMKQYEGFIERKFPRFFKLYRVFMDGVGGFYRDMRELTRIQAKVQELPEGVAGLTRQELEIQYQMPIDMFKITPLLVVSAIPLCQYVTMPLAYMYPRKLLTRHFWTLQQRSEFAVLNLQDRISYNLTIFRLLQSKLPQMKNDPLYEKWSSILGLLGSGLHPTARDLIEVKDLFVRPPNNAKSLSYSHVTSLCHIHGTGSLWFRKIRLMRRAKMIHFMDMAIVREGGPTVLASDVLRECCYMRGLNASNLGNDELVHWLDQWIQVSKVIDPKNFSLLLHLPVLIAYNHPNNWKLLYRDRPVA